MMQFHRTTRPQAELFLITGFLMFATGCSPTGGSAGGGRIGLELRGGRDEVVQDASGLNVTDETGRPIAGAQILIGQKLDSPFSGNFITVDNSGHANLPSSWTDAEPITIAATGFVRATYFARTPQNATFALRHSGQDGKNYELTGETKGYGDIQDGVAEFGLVIPTFTRGEATVFDPMSIVSPETDTMTVMGKSIEIPSNLAIPTQTQTYFIPLSISKPTYRYEFTHPQKTQVAAVHVTVPTQALVDAAQSGINIVTIVNKLTFVGGGMKNVEVSGSQTTLDMPINQTTFSPSVPVVAPNFASTQQMIAVAAEESDGAFKISDVKVLASGENVKLNAPDSGSSRGIVMSILRPVQEHESTIGAKNFIFSAVISATGSLSDVSSSPVDFLDPVTPPQVGAGALAMVPPKKVHGIEPVLTYALLSRVEILTHGKYKLEKKTPQWELYASDWVSDIRLPTWPSGASSIELTDGQQRWETFFAGRYGAETVPVLAGPQALEKVTHVTRSAVDL